MNIIQELMYKTGCGFIDAREALEKCDNNIDVACEYLLLKGQALARYKKVNGERRPWQEEDYIEAAKSIMSV